MKNKKREYYYRNYTDDVLESKNQNYKLTENYKWIHNNIFYKLCSNILYFIAKIFSYIYCKGVLRVKIKNKEILKKYKNTGYFVFGNHTQAMGDAFMPAIVNNKKRIYVVVSPSNLGVSGIGRFLPMLGALPIPDKLSKMKLFHKAINTRIKEKKCVVIYPEAHVWPYYTEIRPFVNTAFKFPVNLDAPSFCMTTTYQKRKNTDKPKITIYVDGPFFGDSNLPKEEKVQDLHNKIYDCMKTRSKESNYNYIQYKKGE